MILAGAAWIESAALAPSVISVLVGATVRGVIVLLLAAAVVRLWPRTSAAQRHVVWMVACCSLLLLPVLPLVVPVWRVPVLPATTVAPLVNRIHLADQQAVSSPATVVRRDASGGLTKTAGWSLPTSMWLLLVLVGWGSGTVVVLTVLVDSHRQVWRFASDARPLTDAGMLAILARAQRTVRVARQVPVKLHASTVPMVCGVLRPVIVLPVDACTWGEERLFNIVVHELAHIRRSDSLTQTAASLACALYWFNPFVWLAVRTLQAEQEQACDDAVLSAGSRPREYATDLLELTQTFQPTGAMSLAALPFARPSELQTRMQSVIDRSRNRSRVSRRGAIAVWGAGLGVMYPLVGLTPQMRDAEIRPLISMMENGKMHKIKQTAMVASAAAGLMAGNPVSGQVIFPVHAGQTPLTPLVREEQYGRLTRTYCHIYCADSLFTGAKTPQDSAERFFDMWYDVMWSSDGRNNGRSLGHPIGRDLPSSPITWSHFFEESPLDDSVYKHFFGREVARNAAEPNAVRDSVLVLVDRVRLGMFPINDSIPFSQLNLSRDGIDEFDPYPGGHWAVVLYGPKAANGVVYVHTIEDEARRDSAMLLQDHPLIHFFNSLDYKNLGDSVLVLIDGTRQGMFPIHELLPYGRLPIWPVDVNQVETSSGHSAIWRYGPDAAHGVLSIITTGVRRQVGSYKEE